ncbi:MAG: hypothetical protein ISS78_10865 [Phycisphaerae bacterium]|nr:hypothetical protein [Phycisphaerae bacterium]
MPTAIGGIFDDSIAFPDIGKLFQDATKQASACDPTVMPLRTRRRAADPRLPVGEISVQLAA